MSLPPSSLHLKNGMTNVTSNSTLVANNSTVFNDMVPIGECLLDTSIELRDVTEINGGVEGTVWIGMY